MATNLPPDGMEEPENEKSAKLVQLQWANVDGLCPLQVLLPYMNMLVTVAVTRSSLERVLSV